MHMRIGNTLCIFYLENVNFVNFKTTFLREIAQIYTAVATHIHRLRNNYRKFSSNVDCYLWSLIVKLHYA